LKLQDQRYILQWICDSELVTRRVSSKRVHNQAGELAVGEGAPKPVPFQISADELNSQLSKQIYELTIRVIKTSDIWRQEVDQELKKQWNLLKPKLQCESTKEEYDDFKYDFVAQYTDEVKELTLEMSQDPGYVNQSRQKCAYYRDSSERIGRQLKFS
jgi:hypothetical protein